ncbi:MAG: 4a-hydroxytetrahydrobiopterin dehydratase [Vicinamibacteria bacterium]|nr:4a-hydroxytetrahydrobiopterin dehydratase [Vicinamibacteria bacterium]
MNLKEKHCIPCRGGILPLSEPEENVFIAMLTGWILLRDGAHRIRKEFRFKSFRSAIDFVDRVADIAEEQAHHPNIDIKYAVVVIEIYTHKIGGLHENDFILASKIEDLVEVP